MIFQGAGKVFFLIRNHILPCGFPQEEVTSSGSSQLSIMRSWQGVPVSHIPLIILKNIQFPLNKNIANIPKMQKALYPHIPKIDPSIPYPFKYLQKYPVSL